jgi:galactokinase
VRHVQTEQKRTLASCDALNKGDIRSFGKLMIASHESLKSDYEVTGIELDTLVKILLDVGALGARMTGAGFGGCVVSIVKKEDVTKIKKRVHDEYTRIIGYAPNFYEVLPSDGASKI